MTSYQIKTDFKVYGAEVAEFPNGIQEAFDKLIATIPAGTGRPCFGLSRMKEDGSILYIAAIEQHDEKEAVNNNYTSYTIEKGNYLCIAIHDWMKKLDSIKEAFVELMQQPDALPNAWCIEWYQSDSDMLCLLQKK